MTLIDESYLKSVTAIHKNVSVDTVAPWIGVAQDIYALGAMGRPMLDELESQNQSTRVIGAIAVGNPTTITTQLAHGLQSGDTITIRNATGMVQINGGPHVVTVISPTVITIPVDSTSFLAYTAGSATLDKITDTNWEVIQRLKPMLAFAACYKAWPHLAIKPTNQGMVMKTSGEGSEAATLKAVIWSRESVNESYQAYHDILIDYIARNCEDYPLFRTEVTKRKAGFRISS